LGICGGCVWGDGDGDVYWHCIRCPWRVTRNQTLLISLVFRVPHAFGLVMTGSVRPAHACFLRAKSVDLTEFFSSTSGISFRVGNHCYISNIVPPIHVCRIYKSLGFIIYDNDDPNRMLQCQYPCNSQFPQIPSPLFCQYTYLDRRC